jgi:hypothetical protein
VMRAFPFILFAIAIVVLQWLDALFGRWRLKRYLDNRSYVVRQTRWVFPICSAKSASR